MQTAYIVYGEIINHSTIKLKEPLPIENQKIKIIVELETQNNNGRKELYGKYKGKISLSPDFNAPLEDFSGYMK